jgi:phage shock protein A
MTTKNSNFWPRVALAAGAALVALWIGATVVGWVTHLLGIGVLGVLVVGVGIALVASWVKANSGASGVSGVQGGNGMWSSVKRWWKYLAVKLRVMHDELADPKVQLEQAIDAAREQHRRLTQQAANVIANQQQVQRRLDVALAEYDKAQLSAGQALVMADEQRRLGDAALAADYDQAAEAFAERLLDRDHEIRELQQQLLQATRAADDAKVAVTRNAEQLQQQLRQKERLLSELDRARMQEAMNQANEQLDEHIGAEVPTFAEVERKIQVAGSRADARAALLDAQRVALVDPRIVQVERAQRAAEARGRLGQIRATLGLPDAQPLEIAPPPRSSSNGARPPE